MNYTFRYTIRSLCFHDNSILLEEQKQYLGTYYFPGGGLELSKSFIEYLEREYAEETTSKIIKFSYLFVVENLFKCSYSYIHAIEHFYLVELDNYDMQTRPQAITHKWVQLQEIEQYDIRPQIVKAAILDGSWDKRKHFSNIQ